MDGKNNKTCGKKTQQDCLEKRLADYAKALEENWASLPGSTYGQRNAILRGLGYPDYQAYKSSNLWGRLRANCLSEDRKCHGCDRAATQVHHLDYSRYTLENGGTGLVPICRECHEDIEYNARGKKTALSTANARLKKKVADRSPRQELSGVKQKKRNHP